MARLLWREAGLITLTALFASALFPRLVEQPAVPGLFWVGLLMGLTFVSLYAISVLAGSRMPLGVRAWSGAIFWLVAFGGSLPNLVGFAVPALRSGAAEFYLWAAPPLFGLLLAGMAAGRAPAGERGRAAFLALYAYSFPMLGIRWLLLSAVQTADLSASLPFQTGVAYLMMRGLVRLFQPGATE